MIKNSLDLSGKIDLATVTLYEAINQIAKNLDISYMVVGATARDLVLHHGYGAPIKRATTDVDFGMQVESWDAFDKIKKALIECGFKVTNTEHRLIDPRGTKIDIVPFGALEDKKSNIQWPPKGDFEMSVLGFREAHNHAMNITIQQNPLIEIPVVTPQGLVLLKVIAWADRERDIRSKDAQDVAYLLEAYQKVNGVTDRIFEDAERMDQYGWLPELGSAYILGVDTAAITEGKTKQLVLNILDDNLKNDGPNLLVVDMGGNYEYEERYNLLKAFSDGFKS